MKKRRLLSCLSFVGLAFAALPILSIPENSSNYIEPATYESSFYREGVAYAAEYERSYSNEPKYNNYQYDSTFKAMNVGRSLNTYRGETVKVAIIDSGINYEHEDFKNGTVYVVNGNSQKVLPASPWTKTSFSSNHSAINDDYGHGTNVAGVIASQINAIGCAGVSPNVELYIYKVTSDPDSDGNVSYPWGAVQTAINHCIEVTQPDVINLSIQAYADTHTYNGRSYTGYSSNRTVLKDFMDSCYNNNIVCVAAAGNHDTSYLSYPAGNDHVISVGSLADGSLTQKASYSNTGGIDLVTSGTVYVPNKGNTNSYKSTQGTSFSAPIVTAAVALYKQIHPTATVDQVTSALHNCCDKISGNPSWAGYGRLNLSRLLGLDSVTDLTLNNVPNDTLNLNVGDELDIDYTVIGEGTYDSTITFESSDDNVVTVNSNGHVVATGVGQQYIYLTSVDNPSVYKGITVNVTEKETTIVLNVNNLTLKEGDTYTLIATVDPVGTPVTFSSDRSYYVSVNSSTGVITAKAVGTATITATAGNVSDTCIVTVNKADLYSIEVITTPKTSYWVGDTFSKPTIRAKYKNGDYTSTANVTNYCTFSGYDLTTAGNYTVTVSYTEGETKTTSYNITVSAVTLTSISYSGSVKTSYLEGDTFDVTGLKVTAHFSNNSSVDVTSSADIDTTTELKTTDVAWTISYTYGGTTRTVSIPITVSEKADYVLVTDTSDLHTGDKVILKKDNNNAVSGLNGNDKAAVSSSETSWVKYLVTEVTGGFTLKDEGANKWIRNPTSNDFSYTTSSDKGVMTVDSNSYLNCNGRQLMNNNSTYRFYSSSSSYARFTVYKVATPDVTSVTISPTELELDLYGTYVSELTASVVTVKGASSELTWTSSDPTVASVSNGTVTGLKVGTATITATSVFNNKRSGSCTVTVIDSTPIPITGLSIESETNIEQGRTSTLSATISPSNATNKTLSWISSDPSVVSINSVNGNEATIEALGDVGEGAIITVSTTDGSDIVRNCAVTIIDRTVLTRIELSNFTNSVPYMSDYNVGNPTVTAYFSRGEPHEVTPTTTSYSVDTSVLGNHQISCTYTFEGVTKTATANVKVTNVGASGNVGISYVSYDDTDVSYSFTSSTWATGSNAWTSNKAGAGYSNSGVQVTKTGTGANATSNSSYANISRIVVSYCTNSSSGAGNISIKIGSNSATSQNVTNSGGTSARDLTFNYSTAQTGTVNITVNCTSNSIYVCGITIYYQEQNSHNYPATPTDQAVAWANYFLSSVKEYCDNSGESSDVTSIASIWSDLASEYTAMVDDAKDIFVSSSDVSIAEARQLYSLVFSKYGSTLINNFVKDSGGNPLSLSIPIQFIEKQEFHGLIILISTLSILTISGYFVYYKKIRKKH